ncbi:carbohydrate ABC transporter permease [Clostridium grantii]|uniref:Multiple sugar transport system permease protein n=1 Tax=Clostridium grantii DSM 8605 TaxID=1121316 RepID=A0A1M5UBC1_9CLOT|nr:sugar ABC transporter permease [Clostridium grantii]SHH60240.1 multiple sugar transport system permease protein [Clostridium grantii DSM 8605]
MSKFSYNTQRKILIFGFLIIPMVLLIVFSYLPLANLVYYSTLNWDGLGDDKIFIGLDNYIKVFTSPEYFSVFKTSLYYFVGSFVQMGLALYFATILNFKVKFKNIFKGILFFPYLLNGVAVGFIFKFFFQPNGTLDSLLKFIGLEGLIQFWLRNPNIINISLSFTSIWRYMGFNFIIFLGTIQSISGSIYEAADIDGANTWQVFRYIILPSIKNIIALNAILAVKGAISVFEIPYIMTSGANGSMTFVIQTLEKAFKFQKLGLASALAIVLFVIIIIVSLAQHYAFKDKEA